MRKWCSEREVGDLLKLACDSGISWRARREKGWLQGTPGGTTLYGIQSARHTINLPMARLLRDLPLEASAAGGAKGLGTREAGILGWGSEIIGGSCSYSVLFVT